MLLPLLPIGAQSIRLTRYDAPNALYLVADRLYNFNMYERSRFNLSFQWVSPSETAAQRRHVFGQWTLSPYIGYSTGDHALKYAVATQLRLPGPNDIKLRFRIYNDLEQAGSRHLNSFTMMTPSTNTGIVGSRFSTVTGGHFDMAFSPRRKYNILLSIRQTWESYCFDRLGVFYPSAESERQTAPRSFTEAHARIDWPVGITVSLTAGHVCSNHINNYANIIAQYNSSIAKTGVHLFAQLGFATRFTPYSRMFDLSGTAFSTYFFKNSFLTIRPNTFTANAYVHLCLNYTTPLPLWNLPWSAPHPFLQFNAMWGHLLGQDNQGHIAWEGLPLQSPYMGLFEPATGFDRLVRWGLMDIGFGVAYQLCPPKASYCPDNINENIAFVVVADFVLDNIK